MSINPITGTKIVEFNNRTIVVSQLESKHNHFRIYIDGAYKGTLQHEEDDWTLTPGFTLPKGVFTLLVKRIGIGKVIE